jgi:acyl-CoA reductase-like NAD-dependent aldehyde dehydrogenase
MAQLKIGNPLNEKNHVGPLIDTQAVSLYEAAIASAKKKALKCWSPVVYCKGKNTKAAAM